MQNSSLTRSNLVQSIGLLMMGAAAVVGMIEFPDKPRVREALPSQPAYAFAAQPSNNGGSTLRREREESAPHYVSYNVAQRTPGRTGRI